MKLAILLDENVSPAIAGFLRGKRPDWDICHVYDLDLAGASDATLFQKHNNCEPWSSRSMKISRTLGCIRPVLTRE